MSDKIPRCLTLDKCSVSVGDDVITVYHQSEDTVDPPVPSLCVTLRKHPPSVKL